ncbi:MAG: type III-B CRISPR module RAMP protein Cmr4 [Acidimicrobiales bacterium]
MRTVVLGLLAETPVHPGSGRSAGVVDLPVSREAATGYPFVPGSGVKGALRQRFHELQKGLDGAGPGEGLAVGEIFGAQDHAGAVAVSDARLALLPVRSLQVPYVWATCPLVLERLSRDLARAGREQLPPLAVKAGKALVARQFGGGYPGQGEKVFLEERLFELQRADSELDAALEALRGLVGNEGARQRLQRQVVALADEDFGWFARSGLAVTARNVLDDGTKTSQNLWYEETLPADCLMYTMLSSRDSSADQLAGFLFDGRPYLQLGGNETVGQGWFLVRVLGPLEAAA